MAQTALLLNPSIGSQSVCNLAQVLDRLNEMPDLSARQRGEMASALRTIGRVLNRDLSAVPASPAWLREHLSAVSPAAHDIGKARWRNIRSLTNTALTLAEVKRLPGRSKQPMGSAWQALYDQLTRPALRHSLCRPFRLFTTWGIEPEGVTKAIFQRLRATLELEELVKRPDQIYRDAAKAWNEAAQVVPGWPQVIVEVPDLRRWFAKPWELFTPELRADIDAMLDTSTRAEFGTRRRMPKIKPVSAGARRQLLRAFISALIDEGADPTALTSIADLVQIDVAETGLRHFYIRAGERITPQTHQIAKLLATLARHWVKVAEDHLEALRDLCRAVDPGRHGMTEKNRATLRQFEQPEMVTRLLNLPAAVREEVRQRNRLRVVDAVRLQTALAVELLIVAPVRIKNLGQIHLDTNLIRVGVGRDQRWHLHFPREDVKNDVDLEFPLPPETADLLEYYRSEVRPRLVRDPSSRWLFPGEADSYKGVALLGSQIADLVSEKVGVRVTPHQFRHLAGFLYLQENPGAYEVVRRLLGHKDIATTLTFYAGMEQAAAARHYDRHLADRRARSHRPVPRGKRR